MPGKERKRKRGMETAAHNCVEIEGSLYAITHITGFRLDHKWNRTTMDDNTVTSLVPIAVLIQGTGYCYGIDANFYCVSGKTGNPASCRLKPKEQTQFYFIQAEQWMTATGGATVEANANAVTL